jgi:antitoxin Phd
MRIDEDAGAILRAHLAYLANLSKSCTIEISWEQTMAGNVRRIRSDRRKVADAPQISASVAKNSFGRVLDRVAREGRLAITKHDEPCAVLISIDEYRALVGAEEVTLNTLSAEFDALFERMQEPGAAVAMQRAFAMAPAELGRVAVKDAPTTAKSDRRVAKRVRRARA